MTVRQPRTTADNPVRELGGMAVFKDGQTSVIRSEREWREYVVGCGQMCDWGDTVSVDAPTEYPCLVFTAWVPNWQWEKAEHQFIYRTDAELLLNSFTTKG